MKRDGNHDFRATKLEWYRKRTEEASEIRHEYPHGQWSIGREDPQAVVDAFRTLRIAPGLVLRAYQFMESAGGNGVVYAMKEGEAFPPPDQLDHPTQHLWETPRPPGALPDVMDAVQGDDTAWSYVEASLCARALHEFGAYWHGIGWSLHHIIDDDGRFTEDWKWKGRRPGSMKPTVYVGPRVVRVRFYSYCMLGQESVTRHEDRYRRGAYRCTSSDNRDVATGPLCMLL